MTTHDDVEHVDFVLTEVRTLDDSLGEFCGLASAFDVADSHGTTVRPGAFARSLSSGDKVPVHLEHQTYVGHLTEASETLRGLEVRGKLDLATKSGRSAYGALKGRRLGGLSIGFQRPLDQRNRADITDLELIEVSLVRSPSNPRTLVESVRSADDALHTRSATAVADFQTITKDHTMTEIQDLISVEQRAGLVAKTGTLIDAAKAENRSLTDTETDQIETATEAIKRFDEAALERRNAERNAEINQAIAELTDTRSAARFGAPSLLVSDEHLRGHAAALHEGRVYGAIETRARVTAGSDLGSAGGWHPGSPNSPRHLIAFSGLPVSPLVGKAATVPAYTPATAAAGVDEGSNHGEYDSINPVSLSALRYGRWTDVSSVANEFDDLVGINTLHGWAIAKDLDLVAVTAIETAASTPVAVVTDLETAVRQAILTVAAATFSDETQLVIVGKPADLALLVGTVPANGQDVGSLAVRFNGARLYPSTAATANQLDIFAPNAFRAFMSPLQSASTIDPKSGANVFGSWLHSTSLAQQITGAAVAVDSTPPTP